MLEASKRLQAGESVTLRPRGNSMTPLIRSGEEVTIRPIEVGETLSKGDIVLAKVRGRFYLHKISAIRDKSVQISNNHGRINGWTTLEKVYGKVER